MSSILQDLQEIEEYYCSLREVGDSKLSIYDIWEQSSAFNNSITPASYCADYRSHIALKLSSLTANQACIFSIGCGNGFVEKELINLKHRVKAVDCNQKAVHLTRQKGVDAFVADFFKLTTAHFQDVDLVYTDGLIGHLFHPQKELELTLKKFKDLNLKSGTYIVISNDAPQDPNADFAPHDQVSGFWFISKHYLEKSLASYGFTIISNYYFPYLRPLSGIRNRTICIAQV